MNMEYLAVDSNVKLADAEAMIWSLHNIGMERVDTMSEAIQNLLAKDYLYVGINGDVINFMPLLSTMRRTTTVPILIVTSRFTTQMEVSALENGADLYARWHKTTEDNIASVLAHVSKATKPKSIRKPKFRIITCGNLLAIPNNRMVFCNDAEVILTAKEYLVFYYLLMNRNFTLSVKQIVQKAWGGEEVSKEAVWKTVDRVRNRLKDAGFNGSIITQQREMGYRFVVN